MKKTIVTLMSTAVLTTAIVYGGGDVVPIEPIYEEPIAVDSSGVYLGLGFGQGFVRDDFSSEEMKANILMLQGGYQYNQYIALEGRYSFDFSTDYDAGILGANAYPYDGSFSSWGIYLKPMYPIGDFNIYALLGYGEVMLDDLVGGDAVEGGFQWGLGGSYTLTQNISFYVDYVRLYDDVGFDYRAKTVDVDSDEWTLGVSYKF